jgi:hypothetical protein
MKLGWRTREPTVSSRTKADKYFCTMIRSLGRGSSVGIATRYGLEGPVMESRCGERFFASFRTDPGTYPVAYPGTYLVAYPVSYKVGTGYLLEVTLPGIGVDYHPPPSAKVKERVQIYFYSLSVPSWPVRSVKFTCL